MISRAVGAGPAGEPSVQWATTATASSSYGTGTANWSPSKATGAPDESSCGASGRSWAPSSTSSLGPEWLRLEYAMPAKAVGVKVVENRNSGSVTKVELIDEAGAAHTVWTGQDPTTCGGTLEVKFEETAYRVKAVKVTTGNVTWEEIDAVGLVTAPPPVPTTTSTYAYDANGLRVAKSDASGETRYLLDGLSVVAQYAPTGERQAFYVQSLARIDEVLSVVNSAGKFWYQADALGSVYTLTTAAGDVRARGGYDVFGEPTAEYGQQVGQPFGFAGREHELDAGLVYARDRYLAPSVGMWTQADRWGLMGGPALYGYVSANPIMLTDPSGRLPLPLWGALIGGVFGYVSGVMSGLEGAELVAYTANAAVQGAVAMALPLMKLFPVATAAFINVVFSFTTSLVGQWIQKRAGVRNEYDLGSMFLSAALAGFGTLSAGYRVVEGAAGYRAISVFDGLAAGSEPWQAVANSFSLRAAGVGGFWDFFVQSLFLPYRNLFEAERAYQEANDTPALVCSP